MKFANLLRRTLFLNIMKMEISTVQTGRNNIKEGQAEILLTSEKVFYNPVQEFNRDLSIAILSVFTEDYKQEKLTRLQEKLNKSQKNVSNVVEDMEGTTDNPEIPVIILEALSATGLRSIRYAKEVPNITKIIANDISEQAVETIKSNIMYNGVEELVETSHDDACMVMYKHKHPAKRFAAIDLDPYGCPSIFLDSAVQSVQDGGLLLITATDMAVLAGNTPETCYSKYGSISLKTRCVHEMALRILLQSIEHHANRYGRYIVPLLSVSADFYVRVFVKVYSGPVHCKKTTSKLSMVYHCVGCGHVALQPLGGFKPNPNENNPHQMKAFLPTGPPVGKTCEHCDQKYHLGGPIWSAPIHDEKFVTKLLTYIEDKFYLFGTAKRMQGVLSMICEELNDVPLYFLVDKIFGRVHLETMPMLIMRSAILNAGYEVSYSHAAKMSVKTNAPWQLIWDIVRTWEKSHPIKPSKLESDLIAKAILSKPIMTTVKLDMHPNANPTSRKDRQLRFQFNPTPHWGPGSRAVVNVGEMKNPKAKRNQNKNINKHKRMGKRLHSSTSEEEHRKKGIVESESIQSM